RSVYSISGFNFSGSGQNAGMSFINLKHWDERPGRDLTADAVIQRASQAFSSIRDADVFVMNPPAIRGLGQSGGFEFQLQARGTTDRQTLQQLRTQLLEQANTDAILTSVRLGSLDDKPQLHVDIDQAKASALGLSISDINATLSA